MTTLGVLMISKRIHKQPINAPMAYKKYHSKELNSNVYIMKPIPIDTTKNLKGVFIRGLSKFETVNSPSVKNGIKNKFSIFAASGSTKASTKLEKNPEIELSFYKLNESNSSSL